MISSRLSFYKRGLFPQFARFFLVGKRSSPFFLNPGTRSFGVSPFSRTADSSASAKGTTLQTTNPKLHADGKLIFSRSEVAKHFTDTDCWIIIHDKVYNVTIWLDFHPGGKKILLERGGQDATFYFQQRFHSYQAREIMKDFHIGYCFEKKRYDLYTDAQVDPQLPISRIDD
eukprot:TRINITY_DN5376_c0_g5_i2.p1 TRINITY_DN5376_c0_g5~~TRINITY_DN5376_c0_g5_i2.p1  ORF type:complete len:172 (+),score=13.08 TRINITY_DN5376_c0_g5_i2:32-547(+)